MTRYILDASSILRMTDQEPGFARVRDLFHAAANGDVSLYISAVNWGEVVHALYKKNDRAKAQLIASHLATLPLQIVPADKEAAEAAARFRFGHKVPYADSFAGALAQELAAGSAATLVTADFDFKQLPKGTIKVEFLPSK